MKVGLLDFDTVPNAPTSKFLTKEEMKLIDPNWIWNRKSFIFKHNVPLSVDRKIADFLVKKYESVKYQNKKEDLNNLSYNNLKKMAKNKGVPHKDTFVTKEKLIKMIEIVDV